MHFTLGVVLENTGDLDDALEMYLADNHDYDEFNDLTEQLREDYDKNNDGSQTFEEYVKEEGYREEDGCKAEDKRYGYYSNPNTEMDWCELGGRWKGSLLIKQDVDAENYKIALPDIFERLQLRSAIKVGDFSEFKDLTEDLKLEFEAESNPETREECSYGKVFETFLEFAKATGYVEKDGRFGYYYNPNAVVSEVVPIKTAPEGYRWVDIARIKDIEWEKMRELGKMANFYSFLGSSEGWKFVDGDEELFFERLQEEDENFLLAMVDYHL